MKSLLTLKLLTKLLLSLTKSLLIALIPEVRQLLVQNVCIPALNALPRPLSTRTAKSLRATLTSKLSRHITKSLLTLTPDLLLNLLSNLLLTLSRTPSFCLAHRIRNRPSMSLVVIL